MISPLYLFLKKKKKGGVLAVELKRTSFHSKNARTLIIDEWFKLLKFKKLYEKNR